MRYRTGGSSGNPLVFYTDSDKETWHNAHKLRCRAWHGVLPGSRQADFWGSPIELDARSMLRKAKDRWLLDHVIFPARGLNSERLAEYAERLRRFAPRLVYGYPTVIDRMAEFVASHRGVLGGWRPALIVCTSEMLYDDQRARIGESFQCRVANEYGSRDAGYIAHECPHGSLHIVAEHVLVEVDAPDSNGVGDLLVTNLDGYGMPFVRYRVGDRGRLSETPCKCGLPLPVLEKLDGRVSDLLVGRDGMLIHSANAVYLFRDLPGLAQFKVIQEADRSLRVFMVASPKIADDMLGLLRASLQRLLSLPVTVQFTHTDVIAPEPSGKYRRVVSKVEAQQPLAPREFT
jgi:phenylacetate-CoA ligase